MSVTGTVPSVTFVGQFLLFLENGVLEHVSVCMFLCVFLCVVVRLCVLL